ncbi:MAG: prefoldin subunit alpha [Nitrososphaerota archaeon]|nr:prefoldin subunit alpha [Nitrososphaerota archaeon]
MSRTNKPQPSQLTQEQAEQQLNQLVGEIRILEAYYNELVAKIQTASAGISDARSSRESIDTLMKNPNGEFLLPLGSGLLLPANGLNAKTVVVNVGAGVAIERDFDTAKAFLMTREKELETALNSLEQQRREIGSRLDAGRSLLQQITGQN